MRALLPLVLLAAPAAARTTAEQQTWLRQSAIQPVGPVDLTLELQSRTAEGFDSGRLFFVRPTVDYRVAEGVSVGGGLFFGVYPRVSGDDRHERRLFQQVGWSGSLGGTRIASRTRLEQRRFRDGDDTGWRLRQQLRVSHPLGHRAKAPRALVYAEGFVHLNDTDWGARRGFDQGRAFVGLELPLRDRSTIELGYLNQTVNGRRGTVQVAHAVALALTLRK